MSRDDDTHRWEENRKLIIFLYRRFGLAETMGLMHGWNFNATKREYVYRLGVWGTKKNAAPKDTTRPPRGQFSDLEELYLCLSPSQAFDSYRKQVDTTGDGEQVLCLLLCLARAVETDAQIRDLAEYIERRLGKDNTGDDKEVFSFLRILRSYVLHRAGQVPLDVQLAAEESVRFLMSDGCAAEAKTRRRTPYVIDIPKLMLFCYGMTMCGINGELQRNKLIGFHVSRLSDPGNPAACESTLKKHLEWCREKLSSPAARDFSLEILAMPCHDVDSGSLRKAIAYVFCFLLSQYVKEQGNVEAVPRKVNEGLRLSVCDLLYTLSALILIGLYSVPPLDLDPLCRSPMDLMEAARQRAGKVVENLPTNQHVLVFFIEMYGNLTLPTAYSFQEKMFMRQVCERSEALILSLEEQSEAQNEEAESKFVNKDMYKDEGES